MIIHARAVSIRFIGSAQLWARARDDRPSAGDDPLGVAYVDAPDRKAERPMIRLDGFTGILQVDGYSGYRPLAEKNAVSLAFCWSHVRRRFSELAASGPAPIASEALKRIAELYCIEDEIRVRRRMSVVSCDSERAVRSPTVSRPGCELELRPERWSRNSAYTASAPPGCKPRGVRNRSSVSVVLSCALR